MSSVFYRVKHLYQESGLTGLIRDLSAYLHLYVHSTYYVLDVRYPLKEIMDFKPKITNFTYKMLTKTSELNELIDNGYNFVLNVRVVRHQLKEGAIGSFIFVDKELAAISWMATNEKAKNTFDPQPYKVDFAHGEVCVGGDWTNPKYRRLGLNSYLITQRQRYNTTRGTAKCRTIVLINNVAELASRDKRRDGTRDTDYTIGNYHELLGLKFWKETPLKEI